MRRYFNTEGQCEPELHYMVRLDDRLREIRQRYVERGSYFVINRGRQYGKTTTLYALAEYLKEDYITVLLDFQEISQEEFRSEDAFSTAFAEIFTRAFLEGSPQGEKILPMTAIQKNGSGIVLRELFVWLSDICGASSRPVILLIDEVDSATNNQVFLDFLSLLRKYYLDRKKRPTFQSVILAGVYDIKNLKLKLRPEEESRYNTPWNIAARFNMEMGFSAKEIAAMLQEYEADYGTGMDVDMVCGYITCSFPRKN